ncbi:hypothetical protein [Sphingomonas sp.]|uniref:hypothetical protein n=1 Tax=Sphingomonas sp. TaxID=28214 RepID=UPI002B85B77B|nr:hypothetical protein [Sphingomonas sp.]HTG39201.1 hypothetical protein [Sphingomonas sp.]
MIARGRFGHFVAIDWSGAVGPRQKGIAVASCTAGDDVPLLVRPGHVWSRGDVLHWLTHELPGDAVVGLDLGPALPFVDCDAYFPGWADSPADAKALWALVEHLCDSDAHLGASGFVDHSEIARHLRRHGGRKGEHFTGRGRLRATEVAQREQGLNPYSNLNLVGAAQVGKSSFTGMRVLHRLNGRMPVWPFDPLPPAGPVLVEIYTALAALAAGRAKGRAKMRTWDALNDALLALGSRPAPVDGPVDDHKSDAILTAAWLRVAAHRPELWAPPALTHEIARTEGWTFGVT